MFPHCIEHESRANITGAAPCVNRYGFRPISRRQIHGRTEACSIYAQVAPQSVDATNLGASVSMYTAYRTSPIATITGGGVGVMLSATLVHVAP